uniref:Uncharacterized protein n=1 Tax=Avena sativa TaxID=4498 RepID=A0ACD5ZDF8_AVESA
MEIFPTHYVILCSVTLALGWLVQWIYRWVNPICRTGVLPPGSMGFPIVGETLEFFKPSPSLGIPQYYTSRLKRYGPVFKTSLVGQPVVVSMDAEVNRFIFQQEGKLFRSWYPQTTNRIFGKESVASTDGSIHRYIRTLVSRLFGHDNLKDVLFAEMESNVRQSLDAWAAEPSVEVMDAVSRMMFDLTAKKLIDFDIEKSRKFRKNFDAFLEGMISFPLYLPGTTFYRCIQGRKKVQKVLKALLRERLGTPKKLHGDFLDQVVDEVESGRGIIDEKLAGDLVSALLFASFATLAPTLTLAIKFLTDNPNVLAALKEEHEEILQKRGDVSSRITWEDYKSMTFTTQVMNEITRLANLAPGIFRKTQTDVQVKGYTIPAGWLVMVSPMSVHLNPELFQDPLTFNPWRWQDETKRSTMMKNFIPFGGGIRLCVGAEFSKVQMALFIHTLVTKYRWKEIKGGEVQRISEIVFPKGYHIQVIPREG